MKKLFTFALVLVMLLSLCACGGSGDDQPKMEGLHVGFGRANITPDFSVGLGGYSDMETRRSQGYLDYIYATCIAFTEGEETVLLFTVDNGAAAQSVLNRAREAVSPATGIAEDHIYLLATHTHSAPSLIHNDSEGIQYQELFYSSLVTAAQDALADRAAATVSSCTTEVEGMNFVRHYLLEDGSYAGPSFGDFNAAPIKEHTTDTDPRLVLVKFDRADESKQDILLVNWQAHPASASTNGYNNISADFVGAVRSKLEMDTGMQVAYFTGASGNQVVESKIIEEKHHLQPKQYGEKLAEYAMSALSSLTASEGSIKTTQVSFEAEVDHSWDPMLDQANEIYDLWKSTDLNTGNNACKQYDFTSVYQARAIRTRANKGATENLELNAFSVGGIGFITTTYEMFSDAGLYIRANSPFETTVICTGNSGYIPSAEAFDYRSYESDTGMYAKGTAEKLAEKYVEMLKGLQ